MVSNKQPVSVAGIEFDAQLGQTDTLSSEIPDYPVEKGFKVQDTIIKNPRSLELTLFLTNTPVTFLPRFGLSPTRVSDVIAKLEQIYESRELVSVTTMDKTYSNMGVESISIRKSQDLGYSKEISMSLKKITITSTQTTSIPASYGKSGTSGANAGEAQTNDSSNDSESSGSEKSWLAGIVDMFSTKGG